MDIDFNSFSYFWYYIDEKFSILDKSEWFNTKKKFIKGQSLLSEIIFIQPNIIDNSLVKNKLYNIIIKFSLKSNKLLFRATSHNFFNNYLIVAWPVITNFQDIKDYFIHREIRHPACYLLDMILLKDVMERHYEQVSILSQKNRELEKIAKINKELENQRMALDEHVLVCMINIDRKITYANQKFCHISQYGREELYGQNYLMHNRDHEERSTFEKIWIHLESGSIWRGEMYHLSKDLSKYWVVSTIVPYKDLKGQITQYIAMSTDLTEKKKIELERKNMQAQIFHANRLTSIGKIASGVAHEINNPLSIVKGNIYRTLKEIKRQDIVNDVLTRSLQTSDKNIDRIVKIIKSLSNYAQMNSNYIETLDIHDVILKTLILTKKIYAKKKIAIYTDLSATSFKIQSNIGKFQDLINILLSNAKDAVRQNKNSWIKISTKNISKELVLEISDNGEGIPLEIQDKIFDSFFTTKKLGQGLGVGLSILSTILNEMRSRVEFNSQIGKGSNFYLFFPILQNQNI